MTTRYPGEQVDRLGKRPAIVRDSTLILCDAEVGISSRVEGLISRPGRSTSERTGD